MKTFFTTLPLNFLRSYTGKKFLLHLAAFILTYVVLMSGFDWYWYVHMSQSAYEPYLFPAVVLGGLVPIILPFVLLALGYMRRSTKLIMTGWGLGQAALLGLLVSSLYKAFTGRMPPLYADFLIDISHGFNFGFLENGVFWGWPSSHTTVAFSVAVAFCIMYRKQKLLCSIALLAALYVGLGISTNIHWFSEFVAGTLIGTAVGIAVGRHFHQYTNR